MLFLKNFFRARTHYTVFFLSTFISLGILPALSRQEFYPFFNWRLFDYFGANVAYDLVLERPDKKLVLLSDAPAVIEYWRVPLWRQTQQLGKRLNSSSPQQEMARKAQQEKIIQTLSKSGLKPVRIVRIQKPLYEFLGMDPELHNKLEHTVALYDFN